MLARFSKKKNSLVPLKNFAAKDLYQTRYLSVLVQRKKLKAKKVGRIYFTTEAWFKEYLVRHAQNNIRQGYEKLFAEKLNSNLVKKITTPRKDISFSNRKTGWFQIATFSVAVLILLTLVANLVVMIDSKRGIVSGVSEEGVDIASSTEEVIIDYGAVKFGE